MATSTILIVEDDKDIRESLKEFLEAEGHKVLTAVHGQNALDDLRVSPLLPSLILLDLMMPVKDGLAFRQEQIEDNRLRGIPVILMSADPHLTQKSQKLQTDAYIKKPLSLDELLRLIEKHATKSPRMLAD